MEVYPRDWMISAFSETDLKIIHSRSRGWLPLDFIAVVNFFAPLVSSTWNTNAPLIQSVSEIIRGINIRMDSGERDTRERERERERERDVRTSGGGKLDIESFAAFPRYNGKGKNEEKRGASMMMTARDDFTTRPRPLRKASEARSAIFHYRMPTINQWPGGGREKRKIFSTDSRPRRVLVIVGALCHLSGLV